MCLKLFFPVVWIDHAYCNWSCSQLSLPNRVLHQCEGSPEEQRCFLSFWYCWLPLRLPLVCWLGPHIWHFQCFCCCCSRADTAKKHFSPFCWSSEQDMSEVTCFCFTGCEKSIMTKWDHISVFRVPRGIFREIFKPLVSLHKLALSMGAWESSTTNIQTSTHFLSEESENETSRLGKPSKVNFFTCSQHVVWA